MKLGDAVSLEVITAVILMQAVTLFVLFTRTNGLRLRSEEQLNALRGLVENFTKGLDDMKDSITTTLNKLNDSVITLDKAAEKIFTLSKTHYDSDIRDHSLLSKEMHNLSQKVDHIKDKQSELLSEIKRKN